MGRKGFTLTEILVVLVILAILAALLIPSLTGYIDRARDQALISHARAARLAAQTLLVEEYGCSAALDPLPTLTELTARQAGSAAPVPIRPEAVLELAQLPADVSCRIWLSYDAQASLTCFVWAETQNGGTRYAIWQDGSWRTEKNWSPAE